MAVVEQLERAGIAVPHELHDLLIGEVADIRHDHDAFLRRVRTFGSGATAWKTEGLGLLVAASDGASRGYAIGPGLV